MTTAGILFSSEVLHSSWFQALAAFVAFNTLLYAGLALRKLIPRRRDSPSADMPGSAAERGPQ